MNKPFAASHDIFAAKQMDLTAGFPWQKKLPSKGNRANCVVVGCITR
jgi:hypothetical protein